MKEVKFEFIFIFTKLSFKYNTHKSKWNNSSSMCQVKDEIENITHILQKYVLSSKQHTQFTQLDYVI